MLAYVFRRGGGCVVLQAFGMLEPVVQSCAPIAACSPILSRPFATEAVCKSFFFHRAQGVMVSEGLYRLDG